MVMVRDSSHRPGRQQRIVVKSNDSSYPTVIEETRREAEHGCVKRYHESWYQRILVVRVVVLARVLQIGISTTSINEALGLPNPFEADLKAKDVEGHAESGSWTLWWWKEHKTSSPLGHYAHEVLETRFNTEAWRSETGTLPFSCLITLLCKREKAAHEGWDVWWPVT
ncbi:hypothetical protein HAX54_026810 [Datura stramonium]|uniref:Uncharacterized protein n=1 Tax=Datura stramonium TaxID=4076 RepID=A0ABS8S883_DATST|nr:hypothetical protein [Datura stramonium]